MAEKMSNLQSEIPRYGIKKGHVKILSNEMTIKFQVKPDKQSGISSNFKWGFKSSYQATLRYILAAKMENLAIQIKL